jgi:hypothetical protein
LRATPPERSGGVSASFDGFVRAEQDGGRQRQTRRARGLEVGDQLEARRTLDQAFGYRGSLQQPANISAQPVKLNAMR